MIKKTAALFLSIAMVLSLTACGGEPAKPTTPDEVYKAAVAKTEKLKSRDIKADMSMNASVAGVAIEIKMSGGMKIAVEGVKPIYQIDAEMEMLGQKIPMFIYYADGYTYTSSMGEKYKEKDAEGESAFYFASGSIALPYEVLVEPTMTEVEGGGYIITYKGDGAALAKMYDENFGDIFGALLGSSGATVMNDVVGEAHINKDGYMTKQVFSGVMPSQSEAGAAEIKFAVTIEEENVGGNVTITAPTDLDTYPEM